MTWLIWYSARVIEVPVKNSRESGSTSGTSAARAASNGGLNSWAASSSANSTHNGVVDTAASASKAISTARAASQTSRTRLRGTRSANGASSTAPNTPGRSPTTNASAA